VLLVVVEVVLVVDVVVELVVVDVVVELVVLLVVELVVLLVVELVVLLVVVEVAVVVVVVPQMPNFPPCSLPPVHTLLQQLELVRHDWPSGTQGPALATPHPTTMWAAVSIVTSNRTRRVSDFFITVSCVWAPAPSAPPANLTTSFLVTAVMSTPPWLSGISPYPCPSSIPARPPYTTPRQGCQRFFVY